MKDPMRLQQECKKEMHLFIGVTILWGEGNTQILTDLDKALKLPIFRESSNFKIYQLEWAILAVR